MADEFRSVGKEVCAGSVASHQLCVLGQVTCPFWGKEEV